jgi:glycosyltransferase involved in cell wall biosynthesis
VRVAIVHYWLLDRRGGEKVLDALCRLLPGADIFTLFSEPRTLSEEVRLHRITTSFLNPLRRWHRALLPLMPMALESFDLRGYDLVVSSESGPAKGVIVSSATRHVCYCHTPPRYLWDLYPAYRNDWTTSRWKRAAMTPLTHYLRLWDYASAARVDDFIANSRNVQNRIHKTYRRDSEVVYPPVDVDAFYSKPPDDYFLIVSALVPYKRIDSAVRVFTRSGRRLIVAGDGPEYRRLKAAAGANISFLGRVPDEDLRELYARCRALVQPGEEDFGLTAVEALASGKPVIALGSGGAVETVPAFGGVLYEQASDECLEAAIERFEAIEGHFRTSALQAWARRFSPAEFDSQMMAILETERTGRSPAARPRPPALPEDSDLRPAAYSGSVNR